MRCNDFWWSRIQKTSDPEKWNDPVFQRFFLHILRNLPVHHQGDELHLALLRDSDVLPQQTKDLLLLLIS